MEATKQTNQPQKAPRKLFVVKTLNGYYWIFLSLVEGVFFAKM